MKQHADFPRSAPDQRNLIEGKMAKNYSPVLGFGNPQKRKSAGSILFEFAIIVPVFLLLVLGGLDLLLATSAKSNLSYVAQETATCAARTPGKCGDDLSVYATSLARGIGLNRPIAAETTTDCSGGGCVVSVTVRVTTQPVGPFFPSINLVATAKATTGGGSGGSGG